jgi:hypothetical protein
VRRLGAAAVAGGLVLALLAAGSPAAANHTDQTDANDTRGVLDVAAVFHRHDAVPPSWEIVTFARWTPGSIWDAGYLLVWIDTLGDEDPDYYALVRSTGRGVAGSLWRDRRRKDTFAGRLRTNRANQRSVRVAVPFRKMEIGDHRTIYRWSVQTILTGGPCSRPCFDLVPDGGAQIEESLTP